MATISDFNALINLFVEAVEKLQTDKSEVVAAQEALNTAQAALAKEQGDVAGSTTTLQDAWNSVKAAGDEIVGGLTV